MACATSAELQRLVDAVLTHRCARRDAVEWILLVGILVLVAAMVVWMATRRPLTKTFSGRGGEGFFLGNQYGLSLELGDGTTPRLHSLREEPSIRLIENFLHGGEVRHILDTYREKLSRSTVAGAQEADEQTESRTSSSAFLPPGDEDPVIRTIETRLVLLTGIPLRHWETLQLTHYTEGQEYRPHFDWFDESDNNRSATVFVYLNDVPSELDGATEFPRLELVVQPKKGNALVWFNCSARGNEVVCDENTEHAGRPPKSGEKYGLNCWARTLPYR